MPRKWVRQTRRGSWTEQNMKDALKFIDDGNSVSAASRTFKIPFSTLQERRKLNKDTKPLLGCKATFTSDQEEALSSRIKFLSDVVYGLSANEVRRAAFEFAQKNNIPHRFSVHERMSGKDWLNGFLARNKTISSRKPEATSINRITGFNREEVRKFYDNLEKVFSNIVYTPNADETGITTVQDPGTILATKGKKMSWITYELGEGKINNSYVCDERIRKLYCPYVRLSQEKDEPLVEKRWSTVRYI
ncbi:hypothetical protein MML48_4g00005449 [Holotrichia oblita]|uniref:Uncharacterized protein n=1 Tax=Holotrichia oblita TaxID=644536 RepID=A0ACB9T947_HOLOL|nr:hypothetical protein MML48_4g00005449 [Holotrichia oblita]